MNEDEKHEKKELCVFFIFGLGCKYVDDDDISTFREDLATSAKIDKNDVKLICHDKHLAPVRGIFSSYLKQNPMKNSSFLRKLEKDVREHSIIYKKVLIYGHSYGGLIASRLAEELDMDMYKNVHIATFGSIFMLEPNLIKIKNIPITNYQSIGDVSRRIIRELEEPTYDKLTVKIIKDSTVLISAEKWINNIVYVCISTRDNPNCEATNIIEEWKNHNNYLDLIELLLSRHITNIYDLL